MQKLPKNPPKKLLELTSEYNQIAQNKIDQRSKKRVRKERFVKISLQREQFPCYESPLPFVVGRIRT